MAFRKKKSRLIATLWFHRHHLPSPGTTGTSSSYPQWYLRCLISLYWNIKLAREGIISMPTLQDFNIYFFHFKISYKFIFKWICLFVAYFDHMCSHLIMGIYCLSPNYSAFLWKRGIRLATLLIWCRFRDCLCLFCWSFSWLANWLKDIDTYVYGDVL